MVERVSAEVKAKISPALERLAELSWIYSMAAKLSLRDLRRLNGILKRLDEVDLKRVAAFAEGLAEWASPDANYQDVTSSEGKEGGGSQEDARPSDEDGFCAG